MIQKQNPHLITFLNLIGCLKLKSILIGQGHVVVQRLKLIGWCELVSSNAIGCSEQWGWLLIGCVKLRRAQVGWIVLG